MKLIGITGRVGVGKTTIAQCLSGMCGFKLQSFGTPLKKAVSDLFMIPLSDLYDSNKKEKLNPFWNKTSREILQIFGTECVRNHFGKDFWVKRMKRTLEQYDASSVVIDDVRFPEEADMIIKKGGFVIKVARPDNPYQINQSHISEQMNDIPFTVLIDNNSSILALHTKVLCALKESNI